jgi:hypothetical protein
MGRCLYTTTYKTSRPYVMQYVYPHNLVVFHTSFHGFDRFLEAFAKLEKLLLDSLCLPACPHETTRFPLGGCSRNLVFENFRKSLEKISSFIKIWQKLRVLYKKIYVHLYYRAKIFLRVRNVSDKRCRKNQYTHFMFDNFFSFENCGLCKIIRKNVVQPDRPQMTK